MESKAVPITFKPSAKQDDFLCMDDLVPVSQSVAERLLKRCLAEAEELMRQNKWEDVAALFHPLDEKQPELAAHGLDVRLRAKAAFALGQLNRFDDAIRELSLCIEKEPDAFVHHSSLAFTAYNSLFAANNREIFLRGRARAERIDLAHRHFRKAQELRPDGVTNYYRHGMLLRKIERKVHEALPLFERAVSNWDRLDEKEKEVRRQERKNFVKALFQLAGCLVELDMPEKALEKIQRCLCEDEKSGHISLLFKYFALGKVYFHLGRFKEARDALLFALRSVNGEGDDFVRELLGRTYLALRDPDKALEAVERIPEHRRRPYVRWTEADILCALRRLDKAKKVLMKAQERDSRSRHKTLIKLTKIAYTTGDFAHALKCAAAANRFFQENWGNPYFEGMFWQAVCAYRLGDVKKAKELADEIAAHNPRYPKLDLLMGKLEAQA
ncbi:MAG: tetratricopeptide repeat protein [Deltaproteobacteria bacterium]|nr:tetratricopeptide repeat protein [Deltaproteobacteria bacterium]